MLSADEETEEEKSQEIKQLEFRILAAEIDCLAGLINADLKEKQEEFLSREIHEKILAVLAIHQADPLLLMSCWKYTKKYLSSRIVIHNSNILKKKLEKLNNCTNLLSYLGEGSYHKALKQCEQYLNMDATSSVKKENMSLEDQHNPLMNELLISIINIIELVRILWDLIWFILSLMLNLFHFGYGVWQKFHQIKSDFWHQMISFIRKDHCI